MSKTMSRSTGRNAALAIGLSVAATLFTSPVAAQVLVTDQQSIVNNKAGFASQLAKTIQQYEQEIQSYTTQLQQYQQMLTKVLNLGTNFSITPGTMTEIDAAPLIAANCGSSSSSIVGDILNQVSSMVSQPITQQQLQVCAQIITAQVDQYNTTVEMMNQIQSNIPALQKVTELTSGFTNMGQSSSATAQANNYSSQLVTAMNNYKAHMDADTTLISALQSMQSSLGQAAMKGNSGLVGNAVQAAALTAAFTYQPSL